MTAPPKPTPALLAAAANKSIPHVLGPNLKVVFVGINPGLYSGAVGHHFARAGNRFWPTLHRSGWTDRQLSPFEGRLLLDYGIGVTNIVNRATAAADELSADELKKGGRQLLVRLRRHCPRAVAFLGLGAFATAFNLKNIKVGRQANDPAGFPTWVLPNPSGLNAHYQLPELSRLFADLRNELRT